MKVIGVGQDDQEKSQKRKVNWIAVALFVIAALLFWHWIIEPMSAKSQAQAALERYQEGLRSLYSPGGK
jgi:hypothetical protein